MTSRIPAKQVEPAASLPRMARVARISRGEVALVCGLLLLAAGIRLVLAARGWPATNSDEAVLGLMARDIQQGRAHPAFFYGQQYMGALQAYLIAGAFMFLGPTSFAIHLVATLQVVGALLLLYLVARLVFSPVVAGISLALLAVGPGHALFDGLRSGAGIQDTLLIGALLLPLTVLRLRAPARAWTRLALDAGIGLSIGVGLWCDFLIAPFVVAALLALGSDALLRAKAAHQRLLSRELGTRVLTLVLMMIVGMWPLLAANLASHGATFTQVGDIAGGQGSAGGGPLAPLVHLAQQIGSTLVIGLPQAFGAGQLCPQCQMWPDPQRAVPLGEMLRTALFALPISAVAIELWLAAAWPFARDLWAACRPKSHFARSGSGSQVALRSRALARMAPSARPHQRSAVSEERMPPWLASPEQAARWWGQAMLALAAGLTVLAYVASRASYLFLTGSVRYLNGLLLCTPLLVAVLWHAGRPAWRWLVARARGMRSAGERPSLKAHLALALLVTIAAINLLGAIQAVRTTADREAYGVPAGGRDTRLLSFLRAHGVSDFYAGYWTCYRLLFESAGHEVCAVRGDTNVFAEGLNRVPRYVDMVSKAAHPAYVFELAPLKDAPSLPQQVIARIAAGDPRFAGYQIATFDAFEVIYYAGN